MNKKIYSIIVIIGYLWFAIVLLYTTILPNELKEKLPQDLNNFALGISALGTGGISSILLYFKTFTTKERTLNAQTMIDFAKSIKDNEANNTLATNKIMDFIDLNNKKTQNVIDNQNVKNEIDKANNAKLGEIEKLLKLELESRLTNPFLDKEVADKIEGVLNDKKEE